MTVAAAIGASERAAIRIIRSMSRALSAIVSGCVRARVYTWCVHLCVRVGTYVDVEGERRKEDNMLPSRTARRGIQFPTTCRRRRPATRSPTRLPVGTWCPFIPPCDILASTCSLNSILSRSAQHISSPPSIRFPVLPVYITYRIRGK